jgi:hypothetical protein
MPTSKVYRSRSKKQRGGGGNLESTIETDRTNYIIDAVTLGLPDQVQRALTDNADPNKKGKNGESAIEVANSIWVNDHYNANNNEILDLLNKKKASVTGGKQTARKAKRGKRKTRKHRKSKGKGKRKR